ncbi:MAG TPA: hypothetical protein VIU63_04805, partial [Nitrospira sp.]
QGAMCLLESVAHWDERVIVCRATSHVWPNHPLRDESGLYAVCAIEYGAQAIAAHACLLAGGKDGRIGHGVLASIRNVVTGVPRLDNLEDPLTIRADLALAQADGRVYDLIVTAGSTRVLTGRVMVMASTKAATEHCLAPHEEVRP